MLWKNNWRIFCFFLCTMLFYPLVWVRLLSGHLGYWGELYIFTPGMLALAAIILLLSSPAKLFSFFSSSRLAKLPGIVFTIFLIVACLQMFYIYSGNVNYIWTSFYWIAIPLFCAVNQVKIEKIMPYFMATLAIVTLIQSCSYIIAGAQCYGLPGNWNWNACLIAVSFPFISYVLYLHYGKPAKFWHWGNLILALIGLTLIFICKSKAAILALLAAFLFMFMLRYYRKLPSVYWLCGGIVIVLAIMILPVVFKEQIYEILKEDQRISLWSGVINLIYDHPWLGCGPELFESAIAPYIPENYYFCKFVSIRHLHAHNQFLQLGATMGLPALLAWLTLVISVLVKNLRKATGPGNWDLKLYLFVFIYLFVYSLLDVALFSWPLGCIFLTVTGVLLTRATKNPASIGKRKPGKILIVCSFTATICLTLFLFYQLRLNFSSSRYYRDARLMIDDKEHINNIFVKVKKSIAVQATPQNTMLAAMISFYDLKRPQACLKYLDMLADTGFENYEHNNLLRAKTLVACGKPVKALKYFARELDNYPLSCINLYYYQLILKETDRKTEAKAVNEHLDMILKLKGFDRKILPYLLKNPHIDLRFRDYNHKAK